MPVDRRKFCTSVVALGLLPGLACGRLQEQQGDEPRGGEVIRARKITTRGLTFDALETGSRGEPVLLLHGFPETSLMWTGLMQMLSANGYHCLAPDQRLLRKEILLEESVSEEGTFSLKEN